MKKLIHPAVALAYVVALVASLLVMVKPGAAIFHLKITLQAENFFSMADSSYRYGVNLPPVLFPPEKVLVIEDGQQIARGTGSHAAQSSTTVFEIDEMGNQGFEIYLYPARGIDPTTGNTAYRLYAASSLLSHSMGIVYFSTLLLVGLHFVSFAFTPPERTRLPSLGGVLHIIQNFSAHLRSVAAHISTQMMAPWRRRLAEGWKLLLVTAASAFSLILMEWIFHVTKVSFMDSMDLGQKVAIFLLSGLALAAFGMAINLALLLFEFLLRPLRLAWLPFLLNTAVPAALLTSLLVLWLDSFTYTIFHFGILTSDGLPRLVYGVLVMLLFYGLYFWLLRLQGLSTKKRPTSSAFQWLRGVVLGLLALSSLLATIQIASKPEEVNSWESYVASSTDLPNIILIGSDGLTANHMSLYGYERDTTPNINALAEVSLVAENAYTNAGKTYGSIISLLTGKMPTRTRVIYPPDILQGIDSYQHLPGILKDIGYYTAQIGIKTFVDATTWNIHNAFDSVNQRGVKRDVVVKTLRQLGFELPAYFILTVEERLTNRLFQALYIETIENPFSIVINDAPLWRDDRRRIDDLLELLDDTTQPLFVHVHLVETHGPTFEPAIHTFSAGQTQGKYWMTDFYDDAILTFDAYIGELVAALKSAGTFDQTLLILYTDHAMAFETAERIPLLIHFPTDQFQGRVQTNVQNLDLAPTLLDFLDIPVPDWMEGDSILQFRSQVREPLFTVNPAGEEAEFTETTTSIPSAFQLGTENHRYSTLQIFYCQRMYQLDLFSFEWSSVNIAQHTAPCAENELPDMTQVKEITLQFLASQGYDPSLIP